MKKFDDAVGLFWNVPPPAPEHKPTPPRRTWEEPGYLPYLSEAKAFNVPLFTIPELIAAQQAHEVLICDCELYLNYFLVAFVSYTSGKVIYFETPNLDLPRIRWILENFTVITFNGIKFDIPILALTLAGWTTEQLKFASNQIIQQDVQPWMILRQHKIPKLQCDYIDLIEVAPLDDSLKIYGGRIHTPRMQELPFRESLTLTPDQIAVVRWYCINSDLTATAFLYKELIPQLELRASMSARYGVDLRSKSDAQIAEAVIKSELSRITNAPMEKPDIPEGTVLKYRAPEYVKFQTPVLQEKLETIASADFVLQDGSPVAPPEIKGKGLKFEISNATYQMGLGGLHSMEASRALYANEEFGLFDRDVTSYYPAIILNQRLFPSHLGQEFLTVFETLVRRRIEAKKAKDKVVADSLKITVNGSFGKLGSQWSLLYAPDLMLQVTISGQLTILMLVERLELVGIPVVSANTDGVLIRCPRNRVEEMRAIIAQWEFDTKFSTEETEYSAIFNRDVNNYIAVKLDNKPKVKGCYSERGSAGDSVLSKNPTNLICLDALTNFLTAGTPISQTIRTCRDIRRFVSVRKVKGGAVKDGEYLGKAIRWYQSCLVRGEIIYASNGNKVPNSENCRPCMELPKEFPGDVDFDRYEAQTVEMLKEIGWR